MAKAPFFFREEKNQVFYHDFKLFIFGTDVSPWITSQVSLVKADRDGMNSLSFSLSNAYRAFEITAENLGLVDPNTYYDDVGNGKVKNAGGSSSRAGKFRLTDPYNINGRYSELAKAKIFTLKKQQKGTSKNVKFTVKTLGPISGQTGAKIRSIKNEDSNTATDVTTDRYPMNVGSLVFHKYDPVRFFVKNPLNRSEDEWVCEFTGYLDTKPFSQNYTTGESNINVTCQDIRILMQHMRVQTNPMAQVSNENLTFFGNAGNKLGAKVDPVPLTSGLFADFIVNDSKGLSHILGGKNWIDSVKFLLFGVPTGSGGRRGGIGKLKEGLTYRYSASDAKKSDMLEKWNNIINFGVTPIAVKADAAPLVPEGSQEADPSKFELLPSSAAKGKMEPGTFLTRAEMYALGTATIPDGAGTPDACKVHFLLPAEGTPAENMITYSRDAQVNARVEFSSRLELLSQLFKTLDYQMYVSGMGDIIVEFPMYDFQPTDYNIVYDLLYTFNDHVVSDNINDEQSAGLSALEVTSRQIIQELTNTVENPTAGQVGTDKELRQTVFSSVLASRIGAIIETYDVPGVTDPTGLMRLAYVEFNKRLANFSIFDFNVAYRPYIHVNRPIYHVRKQRFGITKSVTYTWRLMEEASLEMSLQYTRKREGDTFRFITGGERQPISYRTIYNATAVVGQGVSDTHTGTNTKAVPAPATALPNKSDEGIP
jgi:hypothetical protein